MKGWTARIRRVAVIGLIGLMVSAAGWQPGTVRAGNGPAGMDGDGSQTNPYVITNRYQLDALRNMTTTPGTVFVLGRDIDLGGTEWEPIPSFAGELDGRGHTITGLTITTTTADTVGLIGTLDSGGEIRNLTLDNVQITTGDGQFWVGVLVGTNRGTVRNSQVAGTLTVNGGVVSIGGLAGLNGDRRTDDVGSIVDSSALVSITATATNATIGGLVGTNTEGSTIQDSHADGAVTVNGAGNWIGGLVGNNAGSVSGSHSTGSVHVNDVANTYGWLSIVGGLIGENQGSVQDSYAGGDVSGSGGTFPRYGGLAGHNQGTIIRSHSEGNVRVEARDTSVTAGGLVGWNDVQGDTDAPTGGVIEYSYSTGGVAVTGGASDSVGGLVGYNNGGTIIRSHAEGKVGVAADPSTSVTAGGLVGVNEAQGGTDPPTGGVIAYSYSTGQVAVTGDEGAVGGLVGDNMGRVSISYAAGDVGGSGDSSSVGGLVGFNRGPYSTAIENSYAQGDVLWNGASLTVGGLVGDNSTGVYNAYAAGKVTGQGTDVTVGGLIGYNEEQGTADGCYWDTGATGQDKAAGANDNGDPVGATGLSTSDMMQQASFQGWEFNGIWGIDPGKSRPFLLALFSGGLAFEPPQYEMNVGESRDAVLSAQYSDGNRWHITTWATVVSSDPGVADVAKVEPVWKVTGNQAGTATLTASFPNLVDVPNLPDATATVKVVSPSSGGGGGGGSGPVLLRLVVGPESLDLKVGESRSLQAYAEYAGGWKQDVTGLATYQSSDPAVAEVDSLGRVTAKAPGTAEMTVTYQGKTVQLQVTVQRVTPQGPDFTDIKGHWAEALIREAAARGWVTGFPDGSFRPDQPVTRGEFAVMAMKAFGWTAPVDQPPHYLDRDGIPDWARDAVAAGTVLGVLKGYDDGYFRPDRLISRAELGVIIAKAAGLPVMAGAHTTFADDSAIPEWARRFVAVAQEAGLLVGRGDNQFEPEGLTTRAEAVAVLLKTAAGQNSGGGTASAPSVAE
ncbi:S-layer homology domain-containing protein [Kyrpidia sp.]|uniref:S-layer homology domain-containing protein n=1 Tax=Kyrpidia sp. TaxID=2073077 RepID=UPI00258901B2|nr:S-layer homology domain-containing protein [Kyrpidia sp.]MCL6577273.1 S-layer homology domain-containing protein [Kyrpidia sp.]